MELNTSPQVRQGQGDKRKSSLKILMKYLCMLFGERIDDSVLEYRTNTEVPTAQMRGDLFTV